MQFALMNSLNSVDADAHRKDDTKQTEIERERERGGRKGDRGNKS